MANRSHQERRAGSIPPAERSCRRFPKRVPAIARLFVVAVLIVGAPAHGQPAPTPSSSPSAIPLAEVVIDAEAAAARMQDVQAQISADRTSEAVAEQLPPLSREIDARLRSTRQIVTQRPSIETLDGLEAGWWRLGRNLYGWTWDLTRRAIQLEEQIADLDEPEKKWQQTLETAKESGAPSEIVQRILSVLSDIRQTRRAIEIRRAQILTAQNRVATQEARIADALRLISDAREQVLNRLFVKDSGAIWEPEMRSRAAHDLVADSQSMFGTQWARLGAYAAREPFRFLLHVAVFIALAVALFRTQRRHGPTEERERGSIVERPIAAALLLSVLCSYWIYPEPPRLLSAALIALAVVSSVTILRPLVDGDLVRSLYAPVVFYVIHQVHALTVGVPLLPRLLFLAEMAGITLFLASLIRAIGRAPRAPETMRLRRTIKVAACVALAIATIALTGNLVGYVTVANLLGSALVRGAYLALILLALVEILDGLVTIALDTRPLNLLSTVNRHRSLLRRRARWTLQWLAIFLWMVDLLDRLLLRERLLSAAGEILTRQISVGSLRMSPGDMLAFALTVWAAFIVSRFVRFLLDEDVYPRVRLTRGLPYAISTVLHYVIVVVGFFAAVAALGFDMAKVTILAGAFSLGIGFGLQNIFNNFVSGIILLFERPVKVGDVIQIGDASGVVERIGIRASIIRTANGSEIIVPNGELISQRVVNWTLSNRQHSVELPVTVAQGADPSRVIEVLERTAAVHPLVAGDPPPQALVVKFGPDSLSLELRAWTEHIEQWTRIRSELAITISSALAAEKIPMR